MTKHSPYLTVQEAAAFLGITNQRVRQLIATGKLAAKPIRVAYRDVQHIPRKAVEARLASRGLPSSPRS